MKKYVTLYYSKPVMNGLSGKIYLIKQQTIQQWKTDMGIAQTDIKSMNILHVKNTTHYIINLK